MRKQADGKAERKTRVYSVGILRYSFAIAVERNGDAFFIAWLSFFLQLAEECVKVSRARRGLAGPFHLERWLLRWPELAGRSTPEVLTRDVPTG